MLNNKKMLLAAFGGVLILSATPALAAEYGAVLNGDNETGAGDTDGWGRVNLNISDTVNTVCADIEVRSLGRVTAVQIHRGGPGVDGPAVVNLDRPDDGDEDDCDDVGDTLSDELQANPGGFYVQVRTEDFPSGAIRGQIGPTAD